MRAATQLTPFLWEIRPFDLVEDARSDITTHHGAKYKNTEPGAATPGSVLGAATPRKGNAIMPTDSTVARPGDRQQGPNDPQTPSLTPAEALALKERIADLLLDLEQATGRTEFGTIGWILEDLVDRSIA